MQTGKIIILNGNSCAGKSETSTVLKKWFSETHENWEIISIDAFFDTTIKKFNIQRDDETFNPVLDNKEFAMSLYSDMHAKILELAQSGINVIVDYFVPMDEIFCMLLEKFIPLSANIFMVKVYCSYEETIKRLEIRNQSPHNKRRLYSIQLQYGKIPERSATPIHNRKIYDLEINTSNITIEECAKLIFDSFCSKHEYTAFMQNYENEYWRTQIRP